MEHAVDFWWKEYHNTTKVHPVGLSMLLLSGLAMLLLPRRWATIPVLVMACFVAPAQRIVVFELDFNFIRCMVLFGWLRLLLRGEYQGVRWVKLDFAIVAWGIASTVLYTIQQRSFGGLVYRLGTTYDAVGLYFLFRALIRDWRDIVSTVSALVMISVPVLACFIVERLTRQNLFSLFGGVPAVTAEREGRLRCQGAFAHPILAGCFWAALVPLMGALLWQGPAKKLLACVGVLNCLALIFLCASSTPVIAVLLGAIAWLTFPLKGQMRWIRWGAAASLVTLHLFMNQPVWHLLARLNVVGGSTGWHRFKLVDQAIRHWQEWFLVGLKSTHHWGIVDITNEYVLQGLHGGILTLGIFVTTIVMAFSAVGKILKAEERNKSRLMMAWALGVGLFIHVASFLSVSYFGQIQALWYLHLAMIGSALSVTEVRQRLVRRKRAIAQALQRRKARAAAAGSPVVEALGGRSAPA